jgi:hypothetical protein
MIQYFDNLRLYSLGSKDDYSHMDTYDLELALSIPQTPAYRYKRVRNGRSSSKLNLESRREESIRRTLDHFSHRGSVRKHSYGEC